VQGQAQIDLFAAPPTVTEAAPSALEQAVAALNPDMLAPRDALDALYRLKKLQGQSS
jgi:DNA mismatch repair protein MutS